MYIYQSTYTVSLKISGVRHARDNRKSLYSMFMYCTKPL